MKKSAANVYKMKEEGFQLTPLDEAASESDKSVGGANTELVNAVVQQVMKVFSEKQGGSPFRSNNNSDMSCNFAGKVSASNAC